MATFRAYLGKKKSSDNTTPLYIELYHNGDRKYIDTGHYLDKTQLTAKGKIRDHDINEMIDEAIRAYRKKLIKLGLTVNSYDATSLREYLTGETKSAEHDFFKYADKFITGQSQATGANTRTAVTALQEFLGRDRLRFSEINLALVRGFGLYLKTARKVERHHSQGRKMTLHLKPMSDTGVRDAQTKIKQIILDAQKLYNTPDSITIYNPYANYAMPKAAAPQKSNLEPAVLRLIKDAPDDLGETAELAKDVFMLSFYLAGVNLVDLYKATHLEQGRLCYYRSKTESRKKQNAYISVKVEPEALLILEKYKDGTSKRLLRFYRAYTHHDGLTNAVNNGLKQIAKHYEAKGSALPTLSAKKARASWATIARNNCKISKDDVHFCLNHADRHLKVTDLYIKEDFSIIDTANRKVLNFIKSNR